MLLCWFSLFLSLFGAGISLLMQIVALSGGRTNKIYPKRWPRSLTYDKQEISKAPKRDGGDKHKMHLLDCSLPTQELPLKIIKFSFNIEVEDIPPTNSTYLLGLPSYDSWPCKVSCLFLPDLTVREDVSCIFLDPPYPLSFSAKLIGGRQRLSIAIRGLNPGGNLSEEVVKLTPRRVLRVRI